MITPPSTAITNATKDNAQDLATLINFAGEGMPMYFWNQLAGPGETGLDVGINRAQREEGDFSYKNARLYKIGTEVTAVCMAFPLDDPYDTGDLNTLPDYIRPLVILESKVPGSWYINVLAAYPAFRRQGYGKALLQDSLKTAAAKGCATSSIIVSAENTGANTLYEKLGYKEAASAPIVPIKGLNLHGKWLLLVKDII